MQTVNAILSHPNASQIHAGDLEAALDEVADLDEKIASAIDHAITTFAQTHNIVVFDNN